MATKKILVVFGVTGNQGGSVVKTILGDSSLNDQFDIRGITRDPSKPAAAELAKKGVSLVKADLDDKSSLVPALKDAYAVFAVTNWQEVMNKLREIQQGKNIADVAKEQNIQHLIWSSLPYVSKVTEGKITGVLHFDSKAIVEEYIGSLGIPATFLHLGVFMNYLLFLLRPTSPDSKSYKLSLPTSTSLKFPAISATEDTGKYVKAILTNREKVLGKQICAGVRDYSPDDIVKIFKDVGGLDVVAEQITDEEYRKRMLSLGVPDFFVDDMSDNMRFVQTYGFFHAGALQTGHELLGDRLETLEEWTAKSGEIAAMK